MRFENGAMLALLALPVAAAALLIFGIWSRRRAIKAFGNAKTVQAQLLKPSPYLRAMKGILLVIAAAALVIAAAQPQYGGRIRMLKKTGIDVVTALDFSKSMLARDVKPSRIERAKLELGEFINQLTGDRIGLVAFAGDTMRFPLTTDYAAAVSFWKDLGPYDMPVGGTAIGKAIVAATRMLIPENQGDDKSMAVRSKAIILLTDGEDHFGSPLEAAEEAAKKGIRIFTVGIGSDSPELIPRYLDDSTMMGYQKTQDGEYVTTSLSAENEETLKEIAAASGGKYFRAGNDLSGMADVVAEIRKMKQSDIESRQQEVYEDVFQWFLIPAFLLLLLSFILPDRMGRLTARRAPAKTAALLIFFAIGGAVFSPAEAGADGFFMSENGDVEDGNELLKEGKAGEALKAYDKAARALPNRGAVHLNRGLAIMRMGEEHIDQAMQAFKTAADAEADDAVRARAHFNLGNAFFKKEDFAEAIREYKKSLMLSPGNKEAAWNLELAVQRKEQKEEQQKKDQEKQDQENKDQQSRDQQDQQKQDEQNQGEQNQDEQNQDEQNQGEQNQDEQNQDEQNQDEQNQDEQKQDEQKQDEQKQDEQKQDEQKQDQQNQEEQNQEEQEKQQQPKTKQEVEQLLNSLDNEEDNLQKQMARRRARGMPRSPRKDW